MSDRLRQWLLRWEGWWVWALGAAAFAAVPVLRGGLGISWDGLNHHFYLGWTAESPRFDRDFWAASSQSYQFPYLYWPMFRLAMAGASGVVAGVALALLQSLAIPPAWMVARRLCPGDRWDDLLVRVLAVTLAFLTGVPLVMLEVTSNDLMSAIPFLWAVALAMPSRDPGASHAPGQLALSGLLAGASVAFKLSNGPLVLALLVLWAAGGNGIGPALRRVLLAGIFTLVGTALVYGVWGWQLWHHFGNPIYPLYDEAFESLRKWSGWAAP